jgi:hypothetical protein
LQGIQDDIDEKIGEAQDARAEGGKGDETDRSKAVVHGLTGGDYWDRLNPKKKYVKTEDQEKNALKSLKHTLEYEKKRLNDIKGDNNSLKNRINEMRDELKFAKLSIDKMETAI